MPAAEKKFQVLRYDTRGHGRSSVTPGPYSIEQLGRDVLTLLDALGIERVHFCGLSMGGMIGMWLGLNAPTRLAKLVLCNTAAKIGTAETWNARIETVRMNGMKAVAASVVERWLTPEFRARSPQAAESALRMLEAAAARGIRSVLRRCARFRCARSSLGDSRSDARNHRQQGSCYASGRRPFPRRSDLRRSLYRTGFVASLERRGIRAFHRGVDPLSFGMRRSRDG